MMAFSEYKSQYNKKKGMAKNKILTLLDIYISRGTLYNYSFLTSACVSFSLSLKMHLNKKLCAYLI